MNSYNRRVNVFALEENLSNSEGFADLEERFVSSLRVALVLVISNLYCAGV